MMDQLIFSDEASLAGAPIPVLTINTVGPTLMQYGTEEQKREFLPKVLAGELHFSIGYSEPDAGTDLARLRTRAVRDGDEYVINGQKMWTSLIQYADYVWLACRTDPDAPRHKGLSVVMVPTDRRGVPLVAGPHPRRDVRPARPSTRTSGCRWPTGSGPENEGWKLITNQLNRERVALLLGRHHPAFAGRRCSNGLRTPSWPTAAGSSTRSGCRPTWPRSTPRSSS